MRTYRLITTLVFVGIALPLFAASSLTVDRWLTCGPFPLPAPAFSDSTEAMLEALTANVSALWPSERSPLELSPSIQGKWGGIHNVRLIFGNRTGAPRVVFAATYITTDRDQTVDFNVESGSALRAFVDGKALNLSQAGGVGRSIHDSRRLHRGKHLLLVVWHAEGTPLTASVSAAEGSLAITNDARRSLAEFSNVVLFDTYSSVAYSHDGKWIAVVHGRRDFSFKKEAWIEIFDARQGMPVRTLRPLKSPGNLSFLGDEGRLLFTTADSDGSTVWICDLATGEMSAVVRKIEGLARLVCSPDGRFVYYSADAEKKKSEGDYELWDALEDRMDDWTDTRRLYCASLITGETRQLSEVGAFALDEFALSREADQLLFTRRIPRAERPYYSTEFWTVELVSGQTRKVLTQLLPFETRPQSLTWLPGGKKLAYVAASYETTGTDTVRGLSNTGLWLLDIAAGVSVNISVDAPFSIDESEDGSALLWHPSQRLWFKALVGGKVRLFETDPLADGPQFHELPLELPFVAEFDLSGLGACAYIASDPVTPPAVYEFDGANNRSLLLTPRPDPKLSGDFHRQLDSALAKPVLPAAELASFERWSFVNSSGRNIDGWLFYPPEYKPEMSRSWPLVVYYYGGVSPRDERFTFTYHWWAANGYMVYALNPSGAVGYGQDVADLHSNDWGTRATQDIQEGVDALLKAKPFIDPARMAAYGGSYGGFITLDLATKTDRFAALCSDAGISNIASYFGGGAWGFTYGDIALPGSYPWNRADLFAGKSPLFHADKIKTPLLLIHGLDDTNVPAQESAQMFTALKLLGRDVAFVRFPGEDHSIQTKYSNYVSYREMMLEWFDKYVKHDGAAWDARWKE